MSCKEIDCPRPELASVSRYGFLLPASHEQVVPRSFHFKLRHWIWYDISSRPRTKLRANDSNEYQQPHSGGRRRRHHVPCRINRRSAPRAWSHHDHLHWAQISAHIELYNSTLLIEILQHGTPSASPDAVPSVYACNEECLWRRYRSTRTSSP